MRAKLVAATSHAVAAVPSAAFRRAVVSAICDAAEPDVIEAVAAKWNRAPTLDAVPVDLPVRDELAFEDLAGLFVSNQATQGVIGQTIRQAAYTFGLIRRLEARKAIEIGRWRGGGTVLMAAALGRCGELWSIDNQEKEDRLRQQTAHGRPFDEQTQSFLDRYGLAAHLLSGDSHTLDVDTGTVDVVLIDGDHTYAGTRADFERWGERARIGGAVLIDDAAEGHIDTAGRVVDEAVASGCWRRVAVVNRLVHLERLA